MDLNRFAKLFLILIISCFIHVNDVFAVSNYSTDASHQLIASVSYKYFANGVNDNTTSDDENKDDFSSNCADFAKGIRIGGVLLFALKIILPLFLIIRTSIDLFSVVTKASSDEIKKNAHKLLISLIAGALIFLTPTIINVIFGIVTDVAGAKTSFADADICRACIFEPFTTCEEYINK